MATTSSQFNALVGLQKPSLVNQLYNGKTANSTPMVAGASSVKSPAAPAPAPVVAYTGNSQSTQNALTPGQFGGPTATSPSLGSLGTTPVVKHTIAANGDQTVTHAKPDAQSTVASTGASTSNILGQGQGSVIPTGGAAGTPVQPTQNNSTNAQSSTPQDTSLGGIIGSLAGASGQAAPITQQSIQSLQGAATSPDAQNYTAQTANYGAGNIPIGQQAANIGTQYGGQINDVQKGINLQEAANASSGAPVGLGRAGLIGQYGGQLLQGLSAAEQAALAGNAQQLTAQSQAATASNAAAGQAYTGLGLQQSSAQQAGALAQGQQGLAQQGLQAAGQLSTPSSQFTSVPYSSQIIGANGQPIAGSGGALQTAVTNAINQIKSGAGYEAANATLSSFGPAGTNALLSALGPDFNINASNAQAATQASNIQTGGTAAISAAASGLQQATKDYVDANTAYATAQNQSANLQKVLADTGINNNPQFVNQKINALQNQLGSANFTSFITALTELQQKYTNLLSTVGAQTPTVNGQQATTILSPDSTPAQINAAIDALNNAAYAQLGPMYDKIGTYANQLGGTGNTNSGSTTNSNGSFSDSSFYGQ